MGCGRRKMPSSKSRRFNRKKAVTFELVYRPLRNTDECEHLLRQKDHSTVESSGTNESSNNELSLPYKREQFELGEFGLPDDGYDYSQHFRTIGGTGGVYMAAPGMEDATSATVQSFQLREDESRRISFGKSEDWPALTRRPEDQLLQSTSIAEIQRLRKENPDLDQVFAELDSEDELNMEGADEDNNVDEERIRDEYVAVDDILQDDFVALANARPIRFLSSAGEATGSPLVIGQNNSSKRRQSVIDNQFDELLRAYELGEELDDFDVNGSSLQGYGSNTENGLEDDDGTQPSETALLLGYTENDRSIDDDEASEAENEALTSKFKSEQHAELQLTRAMDTLIDSYKRVSVEEAFSAIDGLEVARRSILESEKIEEKRVAELDGADSDSEDLELEGEINKMYNVREHWDCETIISTYSNLDNHPSVIDEPNSKCRPPHARDLHPVVQLDPRTRIPTRSVGFTNEESERTNGVADDFGAQRKYVNPSIASRRKGESKEEKRARKAAVKEAARARRVIKSEMKRAFASETLVQDRHAATLGKTKVVVQF